MKKSKLVVISMDALVYEDIKYLSTKPSFSYMLSKGSIVERVKTIYPAMTYPCHITMSTGKYPQKHGIINNTFDIPMVAPPWIHEHKYVKCEDILDVAKKAGYTTASIGWPVSGHHKCVDYLVNECWPVPDGPIDEYKKAYIANGTPKELFDEVVSPYLPLRVGRKQPESSLFLVKVTADILKKYKPDLLMLHIGNVDSFRHKTGVFSESVTEQLDHCEEMLTMIFDAAKEAGTFDEINWVVTADHGQLNISRKVFLNALFREKGLIEVDENENVVSWRAFAFSSGMSSQIHVKEKSDCDLVYEILQKAMNEGLWGISKIYTKSEALKEHVSGEFEFMVETDGTTAFQNGTKLPFSVPAREILTGLCEGSHGYHPDKGPRPPFLACGPDIKTGVVIKDGHLTDGAPTYAQILGVKLENADGKPFCEMIKDVGKCNAQ